VAVLLERTEEGGAVPGGHSLQDAQVQFQDALPCVEDAAEIFTQPAGDVLYLDLCHQVEVQLGAQLGQ
jgi:hypothetical protein